MRDAAARFFGPVAMISVAASLTIGAAAFVVMRQPLIALLVRPRASAARYVSVWRS